MNFVDISIVGWLK